MLLFAIANRAIDLGDAIVTGGEFGFPNKYREIFELLSKNNVISKEMGERLSKLVYYRNLVSHEYTDVKIADIKEFWKQINVVREFIGKAKAFLQKHA